MPLFVRALATGSDAEQSVQPSTGFLTDILRDGNDPDQGNTVTPEPAA